MTSSVKNNHEHVTALCERLNWFGRGRQNFEFFEQVLFWKSLWLSLSMKLFSSLFVRHKNTTFRKSDWKFLVCLFHSLWSQLWLPKMASGWLADHSFQYANLVVMAQFGNLHMTKAYSNGSIAMEEKVQLCGKSGNVWTLCKYLFKKKKLNFMQISWNLSHWQTCCFIVEPNYVGLLLLLAVML